jgi:hypothetical protein
LGTFCEASLDNKTTLYEYEPEARRFGFGFINSGPVLFFQKEEFVSVSVAA